MVFVMQSFAVLLAQDWSVTLGVNDGLPGEPEAYMGTSYYKYTSERFTPEAPVEKLRITVVGSLTNEAPNGNNVVFALSGLAIYDGEGMKVGYSVKSNADHNSLSYTLDGGGLAALNDNNVKTYFHSLWTSPGVADYHYVELTLERSIETFCVEWTTRLGEDKNAPTVVGLTLGTDYQANTLTLGEQVSSEAELADADKLFVLKGNNEYTDFITSGGQKYTGSGPVYMRYAEEGDILPSVEHVMQLIPAGNGRYLVHWPISGKFLANSVSSYNGLNGWQYSTSLFLDAALVDISATGDGYFEMKYLGGDTELYIGAEMRDGVNSKMKTFDLEHKLALEAGDYTKGYSLPIAFNWSIYKADVEGGALDGLCITLKQLASNHIRPTIGKANSYYTRYGNHEGNCNGQDEALNAAIQTVENEIESIENVARVEALEDLLFEALSRYMAVGVVKYETRVAQLIATSTFSSYPYQPGTYPETSRALLNSLKSRIEIAKEKAGVYSAEQYEEFFAEVERDIEQFLETKVADDVVPDGGEVEPEPEDGEVVYVYLKNGDVDAYALNAIDGKHYVENGKLHFPIKGGDVIYYNKEEYDSCSTVRPQLPTMTSFKFNNKYNPNLNVDAVAAEVTPDMHFSLNSIGKWLTASFQLSDDKAVAYVDTVLQQSKVTRQSFARPVAYRVTYPGYNILERVKVQESSEPSDDSEVVEVPLSAAMLYTNKPSSSSNEGLGNLLDGNPGTYFHSTWGSDNNATLNVNTYIEITLPESLENIRLYYKCRTDATGYNPLVWDIYASNDGYNWTLARTLNYLSDNMPTGGVGQEYTSPTIELGGSYSKLRIVQTSGEYSKNHFVLSELRLYNILPSTGDSSADAQYENRRRPFGNTYNVEIEWLADNAVSVPRIDIDIDGWQMVSSKNYYLNANFRITGYGLYEDFQDSVQIKGRGNSSWSSDPYAKNPYRLKFAEKVKPFGLTKGKSWVLLANKQSGSLMANAIAMKIGQLAGAQYTNHIIPVELYINGSYRGSYMFTEKVGLANNSVDIDEAFGYLVELDTYTSEDEPIYSCGAYSLPVKVSEPDLDELSADSAKTRLANIRRDIVALSTAIYDGDRLESVLDVDAAARFFLANDLVLNQEINHPKSTFLFKDESAPNSKIKLGPLWDFDWGFGYEDSKAYCYTGATSSLISYTMNTYRFWEDMINIPIFQKYYYKVWKEFFDSGAMQELAEYIDSYYKFARKSFLNNANKWGFSHGFEESDAVRAKQWLEQRGKYLYSHLTQYNVDELLHPLAGDVNCNDVVTVHDVVLIADYANGKSHKSFNVSKGDVDGNGSVNSYDAAAAAGLLLTAEVPSAMYWYGTTPALGNLYAESASFVLGGSSSVALSLSGYNSERYSALQFDIKVPDGLFIDDVVAGGALSSHNLQYAQLDMNTYRVIAYSNNNSLFNAANEQLVELEMSALSIVPEDERVLNVVNAYVVDGGSKELRLDDIGVAFDMTTGVDGTIATAMVEGGEFITVTALGAQSIAVYSVDGRLVRKVDVAEGTTRIALPAGLYIVNGEKVLVY